MLPSIFRFRNLNLKGTKHFRDSNNPAHCYKIIEEFYRQPIRDSTPFCTDFFLEWKRVEIRPASTLHHGLHRIGRNRRRHRSGGRFMDRRPLLLTGRYGAGLQLDSHEIRPGRRNWIYILFSKIRFFFFKLHFSWILRILLKLLARCVEFGCSILCFECSTTLMNLNFPFCVVQIGRNQSQV